MVRFRGCLGGVSGVSGPCLGDVWCCRVRCWWRGWVGGGGATLFCLQEVAFPNARTNAQLLHNCQPKQHVLENVTEPIAQCLR